MFPPNAPQNNRNSFSTDLRIHTFNQVSATNHTTTPNHSLAQDTEPFSSVILEKSWQRIKQIGQEAPLQLHEIVIEIHKMIDGFGQEVTEKSEAVAEISALWMADSLGGSGAWVACIGISLFIFVQWVRIVISIAAAENVRIGELYTA